MKTIICGGRDQRLTRENIKSLDQYAKALPITEVVSGCASGIDTNAIDWANSRKIPVKRMPAAWLIHKASAGPIRNTEMAKYAEACIAFSGGRGTQDMINKAIQHDLLLIDLGEQNA